MLSVAAAAVIGILADRAALMMSATWFIAIAAIILSLLAWLFWRADINHRWLCVLGAIAASMAVYSRTDQQAYDRATLTTILSDERQPILVRARVRSDIQRRPSLSSSFDRRSVPGNAVPGSSVPGSSVPHGVDSASVVTAETGWQTLFIADVESVRIGNEWKPFVGGMHVMIDDDFSEVGPGDLLEMGGSVVRFLPPTNPGESDFRVVARNRSMHARIAVDSIRHVKILEAGKASLRRFADSLARDGEQTLQHLLSPEVSPLASALVVGRRASLDPELKDQLLKTGTIHLLSVSGLHLGIVATTMMIVCASLGLGRVLQVVLVGVVCFLFAAVTGGQPPVLRAAILVAILLTSLLVNRRQWPLNTLAFAALILMVLNPTNVMQVGVMLSFVSVATLICSSRAMDPSLREITNELNAQAQIESLVDEVRSRRTMWFHNQIRHVKGLLWLSLCVTLATTPLTWFHFNLVSPIAVIANLLLGFPASIALVSGLLAVVGGWVADPLAIIPACVCDVTLRVMRWVIATICDFPLGHLWLPSPPGYWVAFYFVCLLASFGIKFRASRPRAFVVGSLVWFIVAWVLAVSPSWRPHDELRATFVDVGHGTSVLIEMPNGKRYLYDCGRLANDEFSSRGIEDVLWSQGLTRLDAVIISHADSDHYNALPGLIERFAIDEVVTSPGVFAKADPALVMIRQKIASHGIPIRELSIDDVFVDQDESLRILHPPKQRIHGSDNANSLVVRLDHRGTSFVLPGDLEPPGTETLINQPRPGPGGVLMAPHHGSLTADSQSILEWARPRTVVVSGGPRAKRPEVTETLQVRGSDVEVTANSGAIRVVFEDRGVRIDRFRDQPW